MQYVPPLGATDPNASYVEGNPTAGIRGSFPTAFGYEAMMREVCNAILLAGETANPNDLTQLTQAIGMGGIFIGTFGYEAPGTGANVSPELYTATLPSGASVPALGSLLKGLRVVGFVPTANMTTSPVLQLIGLANGPISDPITRRGGSQPAVSDVAATLAAFRFDGANWRIDGLCGSDIAALLTTSTAISSLLKLRLQANTTFYVNTSGAPVTSNGLIYGAGSDLNLGTLAAPWATIQYAINTISGNYDLNGFKVVIQLAGGTYAGIFTQAPWVGGGAFSVTINGDPTNPANVVINQTNVPAAGTAAGALGASGPGVGFCVANVTLTDTQSGNSAGLYADQLAQVIITGPVIFGACTVTHMYAVNGSRIIISSPYTISGGAQQHIVCGIGGEVAIGAGGGGIALLNTPAFGTFVSCSAAAVVNYGGASFNGAATGSRYVIVNGGVVNTNGGGASFFPGNSAGSNPSGYYS